METDTHESLRRTIVLLRAELTVLRSRLTALGETEETREARELRKKAEWMQKYRAQAKQKAIEERANTDQGAVGGSCAAEEAAEVLATLTTPTRNGEPKSKKPKKPSVTVKSKGGLSPMSILRGANGIAERFASDTVPAERMQECAAAQMSAFFKK